MNSKYLEKTKIVNFEHSTIQSLISERNWQELDDFNKIEENNKKQLAKSSDKVAEEIIAMFKSS